MTYQTISLPEFFIIGIAVQTTNQNGKAQKDIGDLWEKFFSNGMPEQIPNKESEDIYCVYTDYENGAAGNYTTILGCKVTSLNTIPEGCISKTIPAENYRVYKSTGKLPESVIDTWKHIWQSDANRTYSADFDVYGKASQHPTDAEVTTYLSTDEI